MKGSRKRKASAAGLANDRAAPTNSTSTAASLCSQCEEDIPKFKAVFASKPSFADKQNKTGKLISSRIWPVEGVNSQCSLCPLFYKSSARAGGDDLQQHVGPVEINIHRSSFLRQIGERSCPGTPSRKEDNDVSCISSHLAAGDKTSEAQRIVGPALSVSEDYYDKQKVDDVDDPSQSYAIRLVDPQRFDRGLVSSWIQTCETQHDGICTAQEIPGRRPETLFRESSFYLIDCETRRLDLAPDDAKYVTLSYVWGTGTARLGESELPEDDPKQGEWEGWIRHGLPDVLPATIEDAITVTRQLSYRYLWVDCYCIDQRNVQHKKSQIALMDIIYSLSELAIVAAAGEDASYGLPGVGSRARAPQRRCRIDDDLTLATHLEHPHLPIYNSTWNTRGWTFQEGVLARRRLVFTDEQVYYECRCISTWESLRRPLARLASSRTRKIMKGVRAGFFQNLCKKELDFVHHGSQTTHYLFPKALDAYTGRQLTHEKDILNAFQGWLNEYFPQSHVHGLPLLDLTPPKPGWLSEGLRINELLIRALWWQHPLDHASARRPGFPSFSWTGWSGRPVFRILQGVLASMPPHASFAVTSLAQLWPDPPSSLAVTAPTSKIRLRLKKVGSVKSEYRVDGPGQHYNGEHPSDGGIFEVSLPVSKEQVPGAGKDVPKLYLESELLLLTQGRGSVFYCLLFDRHADHIERSGTLFWLSNGSAVSKRLKDIGKYPASAQERSQVVLEQCRALLERNWSWETLYLR